MQILLIEDDPAVASLVQETLASAGHGVSHVTHAEDALVLLRGTPAQAMVVDVNLPGIDGLTLIELLRKQNNWTPILVLSGRHEVGDRVRGLKTGADDYLTKPFAKDELLARVEALTRRRGPAAAEEKTLSACGVHLDLLTRQARRGERAMALQPLEFTLLAYLVRNAGRALSRKMIMQAVWNSDLPMPTNVVDVRVCRLREKLEQGGEPPLIHTLHGVGYVFREKGQDAPTP